MDEGAGGHLIAHGDLSLLGDIHPDGFGDAGGQLVGIFLGEDLDVHHDAAFAVGNLQGGIPDFSCLLTEDGSQQPLLGGQFGLALGGDLTHQIVTGVNLRAHADDAVLVQVFQGILAHVGDVPGDFLGSQLGVPGFGLMLLDVDGGEHVLPHQTFVQQNGVLVVVAFPGDEADEHVLAQSHLAAGAAGAVGNDLLGVHPLAHHHDGALVDAGAGIAPGELGQMVGLYVAVVILDGDVGGGNRGDGAGLLRLDADLGVHGGLMLDAGGNDGRLGGQQRHGLTLHVCAHQRAVGVVVLQEGNEGGCDGDHHSGGHVDIVDDAPIHFDNLVAVTAGDTGVGKAAVFVQRLARLADVEVILHVGGHILHVLGDEAGGLVHLAVGCFHEAVLVDSGKGRQIVDQADVGTFRGLNGTHTAVVGVVNIPHVEGRPVTAQTAGAQSGQTALVGQLGQGVILIHELRQRGRTEEFLDNSGHRPDVDQALGGDRVQILNGHTLPDDSVQTGEADAELVLQQLTHAAQTAVAQMVDVVRGADAHGHAVQVVDGGHDVVHNDVLGNQVVDPVGDGFLPAVGRDGLQHFLQNREMHLLPDAVFLGVKVHEGVHIDHVVGEHLDVGIADLDDSLVDALTAQLMGLGAGDEFPGHDQNFAGHGVGNRLGRFLTGQAAPDVHLLIELIPADGAHVIAVGVEQQPFQMGSGSFHRGRLAGTQTAVDFQQGLLPGLAGILVDGRKNPGVLAEHLLDLLVGLHAQGADQAGDGQLAVLIDAHPEYVGVVRLVFQPGAAVGNHRGGVGVLVGLVHLVAVVHAGAADDLGNDNTFSAVDDEGAAVGHHGEIAHEDFLFLDFVGLGVAQAHPHLDGLGVGSVPLLALLDGVLGLILHGVVQEAQLQLAGEVGNGTYVLEDFPQAGFQEPLVGVLLDLQHVGDLQDLLILRVGFTHGLAVHNVLDHCHMDHHSLSFGLCCLLCEDV